MGACRHGDREAFGLLYERHQEAIARYVQRLLGESSSREDVVQETFMRAFRARDSFQEGSRFLSWLYAIAHNLCVDELRRAGARTAVSLSDTISVALTDRESEEVELHELIPDDAPGVAESVERQQTAQELRAALEGLSLEHREIVTMRLDRGLRYTEIAALLGCSVGTAKSRMHYAARRLRALLHGRAEDTEANP